MTAVDFPAFDNSQRKGWDGRVTSGSMTPWIPRGQSGWEFGCETKPQSKAEADYHTRTARVSAKERKSTTFVFVTPRNWSGKDNWAKDKRTRDEWQDVRDDLPQYAEAAPDTFLSIVEADLQNEYPQVGALFAPAATGIFGACPRSGMLWALELLAWRPERLARITSILAKLCEWKIDDNWVNTPMGTLKSIFRFWMPQTAASLEERDRALTMLTKKFPAVGWQVCVDQFNPGTTFGHFSNRPRWRTDAYDAGEATTFGEARHGQRKAVELALDWPAHNEHTLGDLVERLEALHPDHLNRVWELIGAWNNAEPSDAQKAALRDRIRHCAFRQRSDLGDAGKERARQVFALLESRNPVTRHQWLFRQEWVELTLDEIESEDLDYHKREERIARQVPGSGVRTAFHREYA